MVKQISLIIALFIIFRYIKRIVDIHLNEIDFIYRCNRKVLQVLRLCGAHLVAKSFGSMIPSLHGLMRMPCRLGFRSTAPKLDSP